MSTCLASFLASGSSGSVSRLLHSLRTCNAGARPSVVLSRSPLIFLPGIVTNGFALLNAKPGAQSTTTSYLYFHLISEAGLTSLPPVTFRAIGQLLRPLPESVLSPQCIAQLILDSLNGGNFFASLRLLTGSAAVKPFRSYPALKAWPDTLVGMSAVRLKPVRSETKACGLCATLWSGGLLPLTGLGFREGEGISVLDARSCRSFCVLNLATGDLTPINVSNLCPGQSSKSAVLNGNSVGATPSEF